MSKGELSDETRRTAEKLTVFTAFAIMWGTIFLIGLAIFNALT